MLTFPAYVRMSLWASLALLAENLIEPSIFDAGEVHARATYGQQSVNGAKHRASCETGAGFQILNKIFTRNDQIYLLVDCGKYLKIQSQEIRVLNFAMASSPADVGRRSMGMTATSSVIQVSSAAELLEVLKHVQGGETIQLAGGEYGSLRLVNNEVLPSNVLSTVTITSADPANPAVFSKIELKGVSNLAFDAIKLDTVAPEGTGDPGPAVLIEGSKNISVSNSIFDGDIQKNYKPTSDGYPTGSAMIVYSSDGISVENNEIYTYRGGLTFVSSKNLDISGNDITDIRSDGIQFAGVQNVVVEGNYIHDFNGSQDAGDHTDMIQLFSVAGVQNSGNILIKGNFLDSGTGNATQSIFLGNETAARGTVPENYYFNIVVEDNVIRNAHLHGITIGETNGVIVRNNSLFMNPDATFNQAGMPRINVMPGATDVLVENNVLPEMGPIVTSADRIVQNNLIVQRFDPTADNFYDNLLVNGFADSSGKLSDLQALPGSLIETMGVGSSLLLFNSQPETPTGIVKASHGDQLSALDYQFDATTFFGPSGSIDPRNASVVWNFGDGSSATGAKVSHAFVNGGVYDVSAVVTLTDGRSFTVTKTVEAETPILFHTSYDQTLRDLSPFENKVAANEKVIFEDGHDGQAVRLNGTYLEYGADSSFRMNTGFSVVVDFKKDSGLADQWGGLVYYHGSYSIGVRKDGSVGATITTDKGEVTLRSEWDHITDAQWHQAVLTFSAETGLGILYLDGKEVARVGGLEDALQVGIKNHPLFIGHPWNPGFTGLIDDVSILSGALNAESVKSYYDTSFGPEGSLDAIVGSTTAEKLLSIARGLTTPVVDETNPDTNPTPDPDPDTNPNPNPDPDPTPGPDTNPDPDVEQPTQPPVNQINGSEEGDQLKGTDTADVMHGLGGNDFLSGNGGNDEIHGGEGHDYLFGGAGDDLLFGGAGRDNLQGDDGNDTMYGGADDDRLYGGLGDDVIYGEAGDDGIQGNEGNDILFGGDGNDNMSGGTGNDQLYGGAGKDWLRGNDGDDLLDGGDGDDGMEGGAGNDILFGGAGSDGIYGNAGNDIIIGGEGNDAMWGGEGSDIFVFGSNSGQDGLLDFNPGEDMITLQGLNFLNVAEVINKAFDTGSGVILHLDGPDAAFSWGESNFVKLAGVYKDDLSDANISLIA